MKIWEKFCTLSRGTQIALVVVTLHFLLIFGLSIHHWAGGGKKATSKIAVRTVRPAPLPRHVSTAPPSQGRAPAASPPQSNKKAKPIAAKPTPQKKEAPVKEKPTGRSVSEMKETLEGLRTETSRKAQAVLSVPALLPRTEPLQAVQIEEETATDLDYGTILSSFLQSSLSLPEYGAVKVRLEVNQRGELCHLEILEAQSQKNGEFLKNCLAEMQFPPFPSQEKGAHSFTITFKN